MNAHNRAVAPVVKAGAELRFPFYPVCGLAGTSFKPEHLPAILSETGPQGFFEIHAENYMGAGGPPHHALELVRRDHPISLQGVCMSLGGPQPLNKDHLRRFRELVNRYEPALVSEHLAWSTHENTFLNDLLPLPYTSTTLAQVCDHIDEMQTTIGRPILLENPSTYVLFAESCMSEAAFLLCLAEGDTLGAAAAAALYVNPAFDLADMVAQMVEAGAFAEIYMENCDVENA